MSAPRRPISQSVVGRMATPRTPGEPDPAAERIDPPQNAGRLAPGRFDTPAEADAKVAAAEISAVSVSVPQAKTTMPLRGAADEQLSSANAQLAEAKMRHHALEQTSIALAREAKVATAALPEAKSPPADGTTGWATPS